MVLLFMCVYLFHVFIGTRVMSQEYTACYVYSRVISWNLKLGGGDMKFWNMKFGRFIPPKHLSYIDKCLGGINMRKAQIKKHIRKH